MHPCLVPGAATRRHSDAFSDPSSRSRGRGPLAAGLLPILLCTALVAPAPGQEPEEEEAPTRCQACSALGVPGADLTAILETLAAATDLDPQSRLYLRLDLTDPVVAGLPAVVGAGATPWLRYDFVTDYPVIGNVDAFDAELERLAAVADASAPGTVFELAWPRIEDPFADVADFAFAIKRAAVAVTGAQIDARVALRVGENGVPNVERLRLLYAEEIPAYVDGVVLAAASEGFLETLRDALVDLDPESDLALEVPVTGDPLEALPRVAGAIHRGANVALVDPVDVAAEALVAPMVLLANQLSGDVSPDPYSTPSSFAGGEAWSFVRGEDLALRVVARRGDGADLELEFSDRTLSTPTLYDPETGEPSDLYTGRRTRSGYAVTVSQAPAAVLLGVERPAIRDLAGLEGVEEDVTVADVRQMPVEEILRRLQAFEDDQRRKLDSYTAINTQSLRFQAGGGVQSVDATFRGAFFYSQGEGFDWAWDEFYVNGVRWRRKKIPEIPLIQPEKASNLPLEINFTRDYRYRLRGTATVRGRDCWVVDFEPADRLDEGETLFQGTVWVDREIYARVQTRAVQLGLRGDVLSNDETLEYQPLDEQGQPAPWSDESFFLPTRTTGQQLFSILNGTTVVEREVLLTEVRINPADFEERRRAKLASEVTMVRDTERGVRYLEPTEDGERVVQQELDKSRRFIVGGLFYDESQDFPLPLGGINWLNFDWRGTGTQTNLFVAGPLVLANVATPSLRGSRWDLGADAFALAIAGTDSVFRDGVEASGEDVESLRPNVDIALGRPFGNFFKLELEYSIGYNRFSRADDTAEEFVLPEDHIDHRFEVLGRYNRNGYRLRLGGSYNLRSDWEEWGLPGNSEFDPDHDTYTLWGGGIAKIWHLPKFTKLGVELEYVGGENLDRFSKYQFGFFSDIRVHGYRSDRVRAEEAYAAHLSYGLNIGDIFRIDLVGDAAWATDEAALLEDELLAGVGLVGTFLGPWGTIVNLDVGVPVAGPDEGFSAFVAFLKLFD